jgi:hypothetical protein
MSLFFLYSSISARCLRRKKKKAKPARAPTTTTATMTPTTIPIGLDFLAVALAVDELLESVAVGLADELDADDELGT